MLKILRKIIHRNKNPEFKRWFKDQGDKTLRLNYDLNEESIVFDVGGYEGQWASDIFSKYCSLIYVFEPVKKFANQIIARFLKNKKIKIYPFGLSNINKKTNLSVEDNASSAFKKGEKTERIQFINIFDFIKENNIKKIDLIKINIEGGEYDLLEHLIKIGFIKNIKNIQVQFHDFVPNAEQRMNEIKNKLKITHTPTYQYKFVWENWILKDK